MPLARISGRPIYFVNSKIVSESCSRPVYKDAHIRPDHEFVGVSHRIILFAEVVVPVFHGSAPPAPGDSQRRERTTGISRRDRRSPVPTGAA